MILPGASPALAAELGEPLDRLLTAMPVGLPVAATVPALFGLPPSLVGDLGNLLLGRSQQTALVLASTPRLLRNLAQGTAVALERCIREVRGQVSWSETLQAWGNSFGDTDVYICRTPRRDRDLAENRVLAHALTSIVRAGGSLGSDAAREFHPRTLADISDHVATARALLAHPLLAGVERGMPTASERRKTRQGKRAADYAPALALVDLHRQPFDALSMAALCDWRTAAQHEVLAYVVHRLGPDSLRALSVDDRTFAAPGVSYHHWSSPTSGIAVGDMLIDVPPGPSTDEWGRALAELEQRAGGRRARLVTDARELVVAVGEGLSGGRAMAQANGGRTL